MIKYWYTAKIPPRNADKMVNQFYGYKVEPTYETIEKHDLRKATYRDLKQSGLEYFSRSDKNDWKES